MKRLISLAVLIIVFGPLFSGDSRQAQFSAIAGHTMNGQWCECGSPGCISDPGEVCTQRHTEGDKEKTTNKSRASASEDSSLPVGANEGLTSFGLAAFGLALFLWWRMR